MSVLWWSEGQDEAIRRHPNWSDEDLAVHLCSLGPAHTPRAVHTRRLDLKVEMAPEPEPRRHREDSGARLPKRDYTPPGWTTIDGTDQQRDRAHVRSYLNALLRMRRAA